MYACHTAAHHIARPPPLLRVEATYSRGTSIAPVPVVAIQVIRRFCPALVAVIVAGVTGCGIRTGQLGTTAPAPALEQSLLRPAPEWVEERLAHTGRDVYFDLNEDVPGAAERDALARAAPALNDMWMRCG